MTLTPSPRTHALAAAVEAVASESSDCGNDPNVPLNAAEFSSALAQLPEIEATIMRMRYISGLSPSEIAVKVRRPIDSIEYYIQHALRQLQSSSDTNTA